ncbi:hypothetical protein JW805_16655 [Roseomonas aeriglobus]|nr:hypothetical protein [Roseomonas aeriglobus]
MSGLTRGLARGLCRTLIALSPPSLRDWARAISQETDTIDDDRAALRFAIDSLAGLIPGIVTTHLFGDTFAMSATDLRRRPQAVGIACAIAATILGAAYMAAAGAPMRNLAINGGALAVGLLIAFGLRRTPAGVPGLGTLIMALMLIVTAALGDRAEGAARWWTIGGLSVQPSLILLPLMLVGFARARNILATIGILLATVAMAAQPDRAMAGMLAIGTVTLAAMKPDRYVLAAVVAGIVGFAVALVQPDTLPAMPYVDQILYTAFEVHPLAGLAVLGGSVLLLVPAIVGALYDRDRRESYAVFGVVWLSAIAAAAVGNYPTPIVGYGGSAVIGYVLSLMALPKIAQVAAGVRGATRGRPVDASPPDSRTREMLGYPG